ncbi:hypothetical protein BD779DRAFT_544194 [Infundibulicybe gibba]|nr:hypothetical protein BD779DRAFT_544194 [Infundibulicybe gibba]
MFGGYKYRAMNAPNFPTYHRPFAFQNSITSPSRLFGMQIIFAVLLAVLSASVASAIHLVFFDRENCEGRIVDKHNVYEHCHRYNIPSGVQSAFVSDNQNLDLVHIFNNAACKKDELEEGREELRPKVTSTDSVAKNCTRIGIKELKCYMITRFNYIPGKFANSNTVAPENIACEARR